MIRRVIHIDENLCTGCGLCADACHEGAIGMVDGKAKLLRDDFCDGLGDCLPSCPAKAISFIDREAAAYDEQAVQAAKRQKQQSTLPCGCPGSQAQTLRQNEEPARASAAPAVSRLMQWPVQIRLVPVRAPWFDGCDLLIAADCTAYAYGRFHEDFIRGRITLVGCPKLDAVDYADKLTQILRENDIRSVTLTRMVVPCCGGLERAARTAIEQSGKPISLRVVTIATDGRLL